jgi:hypothetical protein
MRHECATDAATAQQKRSNSAAEAQQKRSTLPQQ